MIAGNPATEPITADTTGNLRKQVDVDLRPAIAVGQVGTADVFKAAHAAASRVQQTYKGQLPLPGTFVGSQFVAEAAAATTGTAAHGEVAAGQHHLAAAELGHALNGAPGHEGGELVAVVDAGTGEGMEFPEAAVVDQSGNAFAHGELAALALALYAFRPAHLGAQFAPPFDLGNFRVPTGFVHVSRQFRQSQADNGYAVGG